MDVASASVEAAKDIESQSIRGRDLVSGLPQTVEIEAVDVAKAIQEVVQEIIVAIKETLEETLVEFKLVDGKGGGSKVLAQGGGKNNGNLDSLFDYVKMKLKSN